MSSVLPLASFKRDKDLGTFLVRSATNEEPSNVNADDAKLVPLFLPQSRSQDPTGPLKSLTILHAPQ